MSKKQSKLTPWFPGEVKPVREGVYECRGAPTHESYQHWNGAIWGGWATDKDAAAENRDRPSMRHSPQWRGLAEKPRTVKP